MKNPSKKNVAKRARAANRSAPGASYDGKPLVAKPDSPLPARKSSALSGVPAAWATCAGLVAGLFALGLTTSSATRAADEKAAAAKPTLTVTVAQAASEKWPTRLAANGNIAAWQEAAIGAEVNGLRINDVRVNIGDTVKRGQVLATFAPETAAADAAQLAATVAEAEALLAEAEANATRANTLKDSGAMSAQQITQLVTAEKTARARLNAAKAARRAGEVRLANTRVVAPDDGVISARAATVGTVVAGGQELFRMIRQNRLEWRAEVTAAELGKVSVGQAVKVTTPAGQTVAGTVRMIAPTVDPQTRYAIVFVDLASANGIAKAGMYARGEFTVGEQLAVFVPSSSVVLRDGFSYVFKVGASNKVIEAKVTTGRRDGTKLEILSGLKPGETVVDSGAAFLADADTVRVGKAPAAPVTPSGAQPAKPGVAKPAAKS